MTVRTPDWGKFSPRAQLSTDHPEPRISGAKNDKMARLQWDAACRGYLLSLLISAAACSSNNPISAAQVAGVINPEIGENWDQYQWKYCLVSRPGHNLCSMNHFIHSIVAIFQQIHSKLCCANAFSLVCSLHRSINDFIRYCCCRNRNYVDV